MSIIEKIKNSTTMSIGELEKAMGFGNGTIYKWETSSPTVDKIIKVADYLNVSIDYLVGRPCEYSPNNSHNTVTGNNINIGDNNAISQSLTNREAVLLEIYRNLDEKMQKKLLCYATKLEDGDIE